MSDLIDRQAAIDALGERPMVWTDNDNYSLGQRNQYDFDRLALELVPPAEPKTGKWERHYSRPNVYADLFWHCSECGYRSSDNWADKYNFCPNCGADMRGEKDG